MTNVISEGAHRRSARPVVPRISLRRASIHISEGAVMAEGPPIEPITAPRTGSHTAAAEATDVVRALLTGQPPEPVRCTKEIQTLGDQKVARIFRRSAATVHATSSAAAPLHLADRPGDAILKLTRGARSLRLRHQLVVLHAAAVANPRSPTAPIEST